MGSRLASHDELPPAGASVHLVGIGGAGMRGLAALLADAGYRVSGCDRGGTEALADLAVRGVDLHEGHDPAHVRGVELLVYSAAVPSDSAELAAARAAGVTIRKRARVMGALVNRGRLVGIAGTHGKTTITAMTGLACESAGLDPTVLVGGDVGEWGGFARRGGALAVVEADEYDRSFLELDPWLAVVSSVEPEHLDTYGSVDAMESAFAEFGARASERAGVIYCADDPGARALDGRLGGGGWSYGFAPDARWRVAVEEVGTGRTRIRVRGPEGEWPLALRVPGRHNAANAAAAFAAARTAGGEPAAIIAGLERFAGVARRLQVLGRAGPVTVVDDYAHHPTEVAASLAALRAAWPNERLILVFQPHLYSRTRAFAAEFAEALGAADEAWVLPIYPSREAPIEGVTSARIVERAADRVRESDREGALARLRRALDEGPSVVAFMGAGDVSGLAHEAADALRAHGGGAAGPEPAEDDAVGA